MDSLIGGRGRWADWFPLLFATGVLVNGIRLRRRLRRLTVLEPATEPVADGHSFLVATGVELDEDTRRAASAFARCQGLDVVDLVPADLSVDPAMDLGRRINPATFRGDAFALGRGAHHAILADRAVLHHAGVAQVGELEQTELARITILLKRQAYASTEVVVAPGLRSLPEQTDKCRALARVLYPFEYQVRSALPGVQYAALALSVLANPARGLIAAAMFCLQPYLVFAGRHDPLAPPDLHRAVLLRLIRAPRRWWRALSGPSPQAMARRALVAERRPGYAADLAAGIGRFFEPRRTSCPWCGGTDLSVRVAMPDVIKHKPGRFTLEQCRQCGHIFQNPRLTAAGLEFYYRDFYDGLGAEWQEAAFEHPYPRDVYQARAAMLAPFTTPESWLDVGAGHAHFCAAARVVWPRTLFDGLDMSNCIEEAEQRGLVSRGYRGQFPELIEQLAGRYDVVSMHHYLEHTREPLAELDAAARILRPGGYLQIEVPDPEWPLGRLLGRYWLPWFQPQHLHMFPVANLERALGERGFTTVAEERGRAHIGGGVTVAAGLFLRDLMPHVDYPWSQSAATLPRRLWQAGVWLAGSPLIAVGMVADQILDGVTRHASRGDAYRVLARMDDGQGPAELPPAAGEGVP
ncbi:class I SAM-dependent methyltransferase [Nocardia sp. NPDC059239]|uniref:class I SAM-dependent methyltransferase n=1 Tax=unclassified Nocardia TaxID=2637762 RepID=UPI0036CC74B0